MNYLQNKCNIFRGLLTNSQFYNVKHKSFKMLLLRWHFDDKAVDSTIVTKSLNT